FARSEEYKPGSVPLEEQDERKLFFKFHYKGLLILLIPLILGPMLLGKPILVFRFLYLTFCIYLYYILNVMAQGAIAFIYITMIPIMGIEASGPVSTSYYSDLIYVVYGSVFLGVSMDASRLSERLAYVILGLVGGSILKIQIILAACVFVVSFLINPTLAAALLMKVAQAVVVELNGAGVIKADSEEPPYEVGSKPYPSRPAIGIFVTCCYSATLGGMCSPFVNPNKYIFILIFPRFAPLNMLLIMLVPAIVGMIVMVVWIQIIFMGLAGGRVKRELEEGQGSKAGVKGAINDKKEAMGPWSIYQILVLCLIILLFVLVASRKPNVVKGWDDYIMKTDNGNSVPTIAIGVLLFAIPANYFFCRYYVCREPEKPGTAPSLVGWKGVNINCPWAHIFMLASGSCGIFSGLKSGYYETLIGALKTDSNPRILHFLYGGLFGTMLAILAPGTTSVKLALPVIMTGVSILGFFIKLIFILYTKIYIVFLQSSTFAVPFATALHNGFLLPTSTAANTMISGWGNIRPYQFV
ncbi:hypothetical protein KR009_000893, partial [Drosophila setifemur]